NFPLLNPIQSVSGGGASDVFVSELNPTGMLLYSTLMGGSGDDNPAAITTDASGVYVTGFTSSRNFRLVGPPQATYGGDIAACSSYGDAYVFKLNPTGSTILYSTYLGGSSCEYASGIAVDPAGNVIVTGQTYSSNFPTVNPIQSTLGGGTCTIQTST